MTIFGSVHSQSTIPKINSWPICMVLRWVLGASMPLYCRILAIIDFLQPPGAHDAVYSEWIHPLWNGGLGLRWEHSKHQRLLDKRYQTCQAIWIRLHTGNERLRRSFGLIHFLTKKSLLIYFINSPSIWRHKHKITSTGCCRPGRYLEVRLRDRHREHTTNLDSLFVSCQSTTIFYADENSLDKEVEGYYDAGMQVPDYVTLLWADDKCVSLLDSCSWLTSQIAGAIFAVSLLPRSVIGQEVLGFTTT